MGEQELEIQSRQRKLLSLNGITVSKGGRKTAINLQYFLIHNTPQYFRIFFFFFGATWLRCATERAPKTQRSPLFGEVNGWISFLNTNGKPWDICFTNNLSTINWINGLFTRSPICGTVAVVTVRKKPNYLVLYLVNSSCFQRGK